MGETACTKIFKKGAVGKDHRSVSGSGSRLHSFYPTTCRVWEQRPVDPRSVDTGKSPLGERANFVQNRNKAITLTGGDANCDKPGSFPMHAGPVAKLTLAFQWPHPKNRAQTYGGYP